MQLVAYGAQDMYLTGNPSITLFKVLYRRHTNFSVEQIELPVDSVRPGATFSLVVQRNGDLSLKQYVRITTVAVTSAMVPANTKVAWVRRLGHAALRSVTYQIGGTDIDKHYGQWLDIWYELTHTSNQERGYSKMIGDVPEMTTLVGPTNTPSDVIIPAYTMWVPLQFSHCTNNGLALPLIALQYHEVRLKVEMETVNKLVVWSGVSAPTMGTGGITFTDGGVLVEYVYLDTDERRRYAQVGHEYLIEQLQYTGPENLSGAGGKTLNQSFRLAFNHPCKEIVWGLRCGAFSGAGIQLGGSTRGRFLAYSNTDDWSSALDDAALNLATGMMNTDAVGTVFNSGANLANGATQVITQTVGGCVINLTITNATGVQLAGGSNTGVYAVDDGLLTIVPYNLQSNLTEVAATATVTAVGTAINLTVTVISHTLTVRDISIPVEDWTDTRANTTGGKNPLDVTVVQPSNYGLQLDGKGNVVQSAKLQFNGHDRFQPLKGSYFNYVQPYQHHTRTPADGINVYSFALHPEHHQPSGSANLSRIDTVTLVVTFSDSQRAGVACPALDYARDSEFIVMAKNYNILRIMSGMGGLAYTN